MVQLNLLPDVKLAYIKTEQQRRLVITVSVLVTLGVILILVLLFGYDIWQKHQISNLSKEITSDSQTLKSKPNINKILTVQNQLQSLTALHQNKPAASRLLNAYLQELTPASVSITSLQIDFTQFNVTIIGTADSLSSVNKYADTLKGTTYTTDKNSTAQSAFSNVVLSSFGLNTTAKDPSQAATYSIALSYDRNIFDITQKVTLAVPPITTRSGLTPANALFKANPANTSGGRQ